MKKEYKEAEGSPVRVQPDPYVSVKKVAPIVIETVNATNEKGFIAEKKEYNTRVPVPGGYVRCIVMLDFMGMQDILYAGDVVDLPDRRFKSLSNRGYVKEYTGERIPNKER